MGDVKKATQLHLRLTDAEAARLRARADHRGLTVSAYVRSTALGGGEPTAPVADAGQLRDMYAELRRVGNNLNQIARALNRYGLDGASPAAVRASLDALDRATGEVAAALAEARGGQRRSREGWNKGNSGVE